MKPATLVLATCNARKELSAREAFLTVQRVSSLADVIVWQEIETEGHRDAIANLRGWETWWPGGSANACPISWRTSLYSVHRKGRRRRTVKGQEGVTPDRWMNDIVLVDNVTDHTWPIINTHFISQAWTAHPERRRRWNTQARRLARRSRNLAVFWGLVAGGSDVNRDRWAPKGTEGHWGTHGTYGSAFYDVIWTRGRIRTAGQVRRIETRSDHDALVVQLVFVPKTKAKEVAAT